MPGRPRSRYPSLHGAAVRIIHGAFYRVGSAPRYPYMPATLILFYPVFASIGDYRFLSGACLPVTIWFIGDVGRRLRAPSPVVDVALLALLLHPRAFTLVCSGWLEPLLATALAAFVVLSLRWPGGLSQALAVFLLPALKQYALLPMLWFVAVGARRSPRAIMGAALILASTLAPFIVWDAEATLAGLVSEMGSSRAPNPRSTSLATWMLVVAGEYRSRWLCVAAQLATGVLAFRQLRARGLGGLLLGWGLALLVTFLTAWQAFVNYFYLVTVNLALAAVVLSAVTRNGAPEHAVRY